MSFVERWRATRVGFKPRDVEEPIDYYWHRPLAGLLVQRLAATRITPHQVTYASATASLVSGVCIGLGGGYGGWLASLGGLVLLLSIVLDCADGQLARIRGSSSPVGRILDGTMDAVAPLAVFHGMALFLLGHGAEHLHVWPLGWAAALSLIWHASQYDVSKNIYLAMSRPDFSLGGDTLFTPEKMRRMQRDLEGRGERWHALLMRVWLTWTAPQVAQLRPWAERELTAPQRETFIAMFRPLMRAMSWLGFGTHLFVLTVAAVLAPLDPRAIWVAWAIIVGPMNVLCVGVAIVRQRRERAFAAQLESSAQTADAH